MTRRQIRDAVIQLLREGLTDPLAYEHAEEVADDLIRCGARLPLLLAAICGLDEPTA